MAIRGCAAHQAARLGPTGDSNFTRAPPLAATAQTDAETYCGARLGRQHTLSEFSTIEPAFIARRFCTGTRSPCRRPLPDASPMLGHSCRHPGVQLVIIEWS